MRASSWTQFRSFSKSFDHLGRFSSEFVGSKISKQNLKDVVKQNVHHPGPYKLYLLVSVIPVRQSMTVRPSRDLWKALGFTVAVGVGSFAVAYASKVEEITPLQEVGRQKITWETLTRGEKATIYLVGVNALVYLMWKRKTLKPFMLRYVCDSFVPSKSLCPPMLLSAFSHCGLIHFASNMYVFYFFADLAIDMFLGLGQFWAFYCTAAVVSSLTSLVHRAVIRSTMYCLGASGAIYAIVGYVCTKIQDEPFPKLEEVSAKTVLIIFILSDIIGLALFRKFRFCDHVGHLGGAFFGVFYALICEQFMGNHFGDSMEDVYMGLMKKDRTS